MLIGGTGDDTFVFSGSFGDDLISDFTAGAATEDKIDLSAFAVGFNGLTFQQIGSDTVITSAAFAGQTITLQNVTSSQLHSDDFIFQGI